MVQEPLGRRIGRFAVLLTAVLAIIAISSIVAGRLVSRQLAELIRRDAPAAESLPQNGSMPVTEVGFYEATGITPDQLRQFLQQNAERDHLDTYPAHFSFLNEQGDCLVDFPVEIFWDGGRDRVTIGQSGVLRIMLRSELLSGLRFRVPQAYRQVKQHTIPLGTAYEPYAADDATGLGRHVVNDYDVTMEMWRQLERRRAAGEGLQPETWREQIRRTHCDWRPPAIDVGEVGDAATIYRQRRDSVVVVGHLLANGTIVHAAGVVVDSDGVIATAYHVIDKPDAVARCVMTADGKTYPIQEILAANRPSDVALIRIDAHGLTAAPLSHGDDEGSPLTIIAHPAGEFFSVTHGHLRRFQSAVVLGKQVVQMAITADFSDGASGGPVFNKRGEVAGIVSFRRPGTPTESARIASPARAILQLCVAVP